ncbi:MAG: AMP-binding protein, partial [Arenicellales bacterium]|nr:AMP-binding protein [Arenicellales bacterium]
MSEVKTYPVSAATAASAHLTDAQYQKMYQQSIDDPEGFWAQQADEFVTWSRRWDKVMDVDFHQAKITWFDGATLNASSNCLDRHLETRGDQVAIIWEGDDPSIDRKITYRELHAEVCQFANSLKSRGVAKGDRVSIYMPMIPEAAVAMLACARIGAVHSVVFGGFSPESLKDRILDSDCRVVITADMGPRGGKNVALKDNVDSALESCPDVHTVVVVQHAK